MPKHRGKTSGGNPSKTETNKFMSICSVLQNEIFLFKDFIQYLGFNCCKTGNNRFVRKESKYLNLLSLIGENKVLHNKYLSNVRKVIF